MAITIYNIKKWTKMICGKSVAHVNQDVGKYYSKKDIKGYYNDLTEKVLMQPELLGTKNLPQVPDGKGGRIIFPVAIFQYGLGAYDLYLDTKDTTYLEKFRQCCCWAIQNQEDNGAWDNFSYSFPDHPYGAMCQGEAASLLLRAFKEFQDDSFLKAAKKAIDFMLKPIEDGGTTLYHNSEIVLMEYTNKPLLAVLNGWIFAWWGLYDYVLVTGDESGYKASLDKSNESLINNLHLFKTSFWSKYNLGENLASPFYHHLHIAQMKVMYDLTGILTYKDYADKWHKQYRNPVNKTIAFIIKAFQKIKE